MPFFRIAILLLQLYTLTRLVVSFAGSGGLLGGEHDNAVLVDQVAGEVHGAPRAAQIATRLRLAVGLHVVLEEEVAEATCVVDDARDGCGHLVQPDGYGGADGVASRLLPRRLVEEVVDDGRRQIEVRAQVVAELDGARVVLLLERVRVLVALRAEQVERLHVRLAVLVVEQRMHVEERRGRLVVVRHVQLGRDERWRWRGHIHPTFSSSSSSQLIRHALQGRQRLGHGRRLSGRLSKPNDINELIFLFETCVYDAMLP